MLSQLAVNPVQRGKSQGIGPGVDRLSHPGGVDDCRHAAAFTDDEAEGNQRISQSDTGGREPSARSDRDHRPVDVAPVDRVGADRRVELVERLSGDGVVIIHVDTSTPVELTRRHGAPVGHWHRSRSRRADHRGDRHRPGDRSTRRHSRAERVCGRAAPREAHRSKTSPPGRASGRRRRRATERHVGRDS